MDCVYFAVTIATSVGYGDIFPRRSDGASKAFLAFYFLWSTVAVALLLSSFVQLLLELSEAHVVDAIIDSTIYVHRIDLDGDGRVSESGYVLFKLLQMQKVDERSLNQLIDRWRSLDENGDGYLQVGVEIPSAAMVPEIRRLARRERARAAGNENGNGNGNGVGALPSLEAIWNDYRGEVIGAVVPR